MCKAPKAPKVEPVTPVQDLKMPDMNVMRARVQKGGLFGRVRRLDTGWLTGATGVPNTALTIGGTKLLGDGK